MTSPQHQSRSHQDDQDADHPETAAGEALKEFEEAETHDVGRTDLPDEHDGEAGDALSTNKDAQEDASGN
ncbi:hypothetical protein OG897_33055 [Streptomyces sp. NBC_00237]|uniref:hypothetical protein n=1 Tax=Streptomyces sp. NBC_00237 TaxID=2975687 RepID=UPI00224EEB77|nr:hypothetical protein [Streptomyces sp. NBC_00237]MCX5206222.1 hypothetical protein [Streptomyces sp. NBC_00237]